MARGPLPLHRLNPQDEGWPPWVGWSMAGVMVTLIATVAIDGSISNRPLLVALVVLATSGWLLLPLGIAMPRLLHGALVLGILGILNATPARFSADADGHVQVTLLAVVFLVGEAFTHWPLRLAAPVSVVALVITSPLVLADQDDASHIWMASVVLSAVVGVLMRALLATVDDLKTTQAELAERAAMEERHRIAREVHDVIAHSLTVTMLHLTAARLAIARGDPHAATEALEEAERAGRRSLNDVRRTVGLLRDGGHQHGLATPAPVVTDVLDLVEGYRSAGLAVELAVSGDAAGLPAGIGIAVYRTVQEALANVARHTPGADTTVEVEIGEQIHVRVLSQGGTHVDEPGAGSGLVGMRERAEALGGRCVAGPDGRGWLVDVVLPSAATDAEVPA